MSLRKKTLLILGATLVILGGSLYASSHFIMARGFREAEDNQVAENVTRVKDVINEEVYALEGLTRDSATRSETLDIIRLQNNNQSKLRQDSTFVNYRINVMMLVDTSSRLIFIKAFDIKNKKEISVPNNIQQRLAENNELVQQAHQGKVNKGLLMQPEGLFLIVSQPIIDEGGTMIGTLLWGRAFDEEEIGYVSRLTHLPITTQQPDDPFLPEDFRLARSVLDQSKDIDAVPLSDNLVAGYTYLKDIYGNPILLLKAEMPRTVYAQAAATNRYIAFSLFGIGILFGLITILPLQRWVLSPIAELAASVSAIGSKGDPASRVSIRGGDELSKLALDINNMLSALQKSHQKLSRRAAIFRTLTEIDKEINVRNQSGQIMELICKWAANLIKVPKSAIILRDTPSRTAASYGLEDPKRFNKFLKGNSGRVFFRSTVPESQTTHMTDGNGSDQLLDLDVEKHLSKKLLTSEGIESAVMAPLSVENNVMGVLIAMDTEPRDWDVDESQSLGLLADQAALALEGAKFFVEEETRREELSSLYKLSRALADVELDTDAILSLVAEHAVSSISVTFARVALIESDQFVVRAAHPARLLENDLKQRLNQPLRSEFLTKIMQQDGARVVRIGDPALSPEERNKLFLGIAKTLCLVPLHIAERHFGILMLGEERGENREPFTEEKLGLARSIGNQTASAFRRAELFQQLEQAYMDTVMALANTVDAKDTYTHNHSHYMANMAVVVGDKIGLSRDELSDLKFGAMLHDIGKIGVPDIILQKPVGLDAEEWRQIKKHPLVGERILTPLLPLAGAAKIVRHHHEHYDGSGYPDGISGSNIPLGARVLSVIDSFSAIIDRRSYKESRSESDAITELKRCAGSQFDPNIVDVFLSLMSSGVLKP